MNLGQKYATEIKRRTRALQQVRDGLPVTDAAWYDEHKPKNRYKKSVYRDYLGLVDEDASGKLTLTQKAIDLYFTPGGFDLPVDFDNQADSFPF